MTTKLWGSRFSKPTDNLVHRYNASLGFDIRLAGEDIRGSIAWANGLLEAGILNGAEQTTLVRGLERVQQEIEGGAFEVKPGDEDIHSAVERRLTELVGQVGGKLHTGRSRNDQVATDFRLWIMGAVEEISEAIAWLQATILDSARQDLHTPMPGYTHLQHAQPVTWGHFILSHFWALARDRTRFVTVHDAADECPLGCGALAGTGFPVDRHAIARELGFSRISPNCIDAVSNRDFVLDFLYAAAALGLHLSRLSEQLILFASREFGFIILDDAYSTGSSIMPQKKNPDTLELTRGKAGRLLGHLTGMMATLKGLPSTYDKDMQEDKEPVFDVADTLLLALPVMSGLLATLKLDREAMARQLEPGLLATDLADRLVLEGVTFREAHEIVGRVVRLAEEKGVAFTDLSPAALATVSPRLTEAIMAQLTVEGSLAHRGNVGGTSPQALADQLAAARQLLAP